MLSHEWRARRQHNLLPHAHTEHRKLLLFSYAKHVEQACLRATIIKKEQILKSIMVFNQNNWDTYK